MFMRRTIMDRTAPNELCLEPTTELDPPQDGVIIPDTRPDGMSYPSPPGVTAPELIPEGRYGVMAPLAVPSLAVSLSYSASRESPNANLVGLRLGFHPDFASGSPWNDSVTATGVGEEDSVTTAVDAPSPSSGRVPPSVFRERSSSRSFLRFFSFRLRLTDASCKQNTTSVL